MADRQHGVVSRRQLIELGLSRGAIFSRLETKRLHAVHRGVYAVGRRGLSRPGVWLAAVLACGPDAVLSHLSAAVLWGIREGSPARVEVSAPRQRRSRDGIRAHRATIAPDERTLRAGIPVTTVPRTLLDLAALLQPHELNRALERAESLRLSDPKPLAALIARHRGRRGTTVLGRALERGAARERVTKSELERRFLTLLEDACIPLPQTNVRLEVDSGWIEVDCLWPEQRVAVELDGRAVHLTAAAFERDRGRDRRLQAAGWRVTRITDLAMRREAPAVCADVRTLLGMPTSARRATPSRRTRPPARAPPGAFRRRRRTAAGSRCASRGGWCGPRARTTR